MFDDTLDDGELHVWRIGNIDELRPPAGMPFDGSIVEYGESHRPLRTHDENAVSTGTLMGNETP